MLRLGLALVLCIACAAEAAQPAAMPAFDLDDYRWKRRPLLVFGTGDRLSEQRAILDADRAGLADREMLVVYVDDGRLFDAVTGETRPLPPGDAASLRERFDVAADAFAVILVGKDGGEKRREAEVTATDPIFERIDAMPMRRAEMRQG